MKASIILVGLLSGCAMVGRMSDPHYMEKQSTMSLCVNVMSYPSYNVNHDAWMAELARRNADCSPYVGMAQSQIAAKAAQDQATAAYLNAIKPPPVTVQPAVVCRTTYYGVVCQ